MENNTNSNTDTGVDQTNSATVADTTITETVSTDEIISMSKADYEKTLQSECDKIRSAKTKEIKALQVKIAELSLAIKTEADIALEQRLAKLEEREQATAQKENLLTIQATLSAKGLDKELANYLKSDVDIETLGTLIDGIINERAKGSAYIPTGHQHNVGVTKEQWRNMAYSQKVKLKETNPELVKQFLGK